MTQMKLIIEIETGSWTQKTDLILPKGSVLGEPWIERLELADVIYYI